MAANWVKEEKNKFHDEALELKERVDKWREGKQFKLVKICNSPPTWKEVLVKK